MSQARNKARCSGDPCGRQAHDHSQIPDVCIVLMQNAWYTHGKGGTTSQATRPKNGIKSVKNPLYPFECSCILHLHYQVKTGKILRRFLQKYRKPGEEET